MPLEDKPKCYGSLDKDDDECEGCSIKEECARYTGRVNSKTAGLSRARAMRALCWECNGGTSYGPDCKGPSCPVYPFRRNNEGAPNLWWMEPAKDWAKAHADARVKEHKQCADSEN